MKILVTGSSGFLGNAIAQRLIDQGHLVTGVDTIAGKTTSHQNDIRDWVTQTDETFDAVYHFAAKVGGRAVIEGAPLEAISNIETDRILLDWMSRGNSNHIIYPSSSAVYPVDHQTEDSNVQLTEDMIDFQNLHIGVSDHLYGWCKLTAERMLWQMHMQHGIRAHIFRPFSGFGPGQSMDYPVPNLLRQVLAGVSPIPIWGNGQQKRDFVYISDVVDSFEWALTDNNDYRVVNCSTGIGTSFIQLVQLMYEIRYSKKNAPLDVDINKPVGVMCRIGSTTLQDSLGITPKITLQTAIEKLIELQTNT